MILGSIEILLVMLCKIFCITWQAKGGIEMTGRVTIQGDPTQHGDHPGGPRPPLHALAWQSDPPILTTPVRNLPFPQMMFSIIISITVVVVVVITEVRNLEEKSEVGWKKAGITTFWIRNVARILIRFCSQCAGKHFRTKLMSLYIDQKNWFDERIQELISKVQNPGPLLGKKNFV